jgi:hypothetical protein
MKRLTRVFAVVALATATVDLVPTENVETRRTLHFEAGHLRGRSRRTVTVLFRHQQ